MIKHFIIILVGLCFSHISAQVTISGHLNNMPSNYSKLIQIKVQGSEKQTYPDENGDFMFSDITNGNYFVSFEMNGEIMGVKQVAVNIANVNLGAIDLIYRSTSIESDATEVPSTSEDRIDEETSQNVASLLNAGRDPYLSFASFGWSAFRYRIRGYDFGDNVLSINGTPFNDIETGNPRYSTWGGLNDVFRNRTNFNGLNFTTNGYGGIAGFTNIDVRASKQWKQLRVGYALGNRNYENRIMATWNTGLLKNGWAFSVSASTRFGDEGNAEGTYYRSASYFISIEKIIKHHSISLNAFGAPTASAQPRPVVQEMYDLAGSIRYNPNWGLQNGKVRNIGIRESHIPTIMLSHEWKKDNKTSIVTSLAIQKGKNSQTLFERPYAGDPKPDYYRNLPSYYNNPELDRYYDLDYANLIKSQIASNPELLQINWNSIYQQNYINNTSNPDTNQRGNARVFIGENVNESTISTFSTMLEHIINERVTMNGGFNFKKQTSKNYNEVNDLLGAKFVLNQNTFNADQQNPQALFFDLDDNNLVKHVGDKYASIYNLNTSKGNVFVQSNITTKMFDFFLGGALTFTQLQRDGITRDGAFPDKSKGKSIALNFINYNAKGGVTYKISGRNYLTVAGSIQTSAPDLRNVFPIQRRSNYTLQDFIPSNDLIEKAISGEASYIYRSPFVKARLTGFYTLVKNNTKNSLFYDDDNNEFSSYTLHGTDILYQGVEAGIEAKLSKGFTASFAAGISQSIYNNNPNGLLLQEVDADFVSKETAFIKNYHLGNTPENVYGLSLNYRSPKFWYVTVSANYMQNFWYSINPMRRTRYATDNISYNSTKWHEIIDQSKQKDQFTLDLFGGGSKRFKVGNEKTLDGKIGKPKYHFIYFNVGVNNILNNKTIRTLGFEQMRYDDTLDAPSKFPMKFSYNQGISYFISISYKI
jgi:hypothetical protein